MFLDSSPYLLHPVMSKQSISGQPKRRPGRPPTYIFSKPDVELSENERRLKSSVIKRRLRQNRSYHRKKRLKHLQPTSLPFSNHTLLPSSLPPSSLPLSLSLPTPFPSLSSFHPPHHSNQNLLPDPFANNPPITTLSTSQPPIPLLLSPPPVIATTSTTPMLSRASPNHLTISNFLTNHHHHTQTNFSTTVHSTPSNLPSRTSPPTASPPTPLSLMPIKSNNHSEREEDSLLDEIFHASNQLSLSASGKMVQRAASPAFLGTDIIGRMNSLPKHISDGVKHILLFPNSFSPQSARHVMHLTDVPLLTFPAQVLQPLVDANLVRPLPNGRYELSEITKSVLTPDSFSAANQARHRFIDYFSSALHSLDPQTLSLNGEHRLKAMKVYDSERVNMLAALQMCRDLGNNNLTMAFLTNGATVMRYSTSAHDRTLIFGRMLHEIEMNTTTSTNQLDSVFEARIRLALGEAYFDLLSFDKAKEHLKMAIAMMTGATADSTLTVSTSVLALVLMAELRISDRDFEEARKLLVQALRTLKNADMQKSTFAVCCLLSLASVYSSLGQSDKALRTVTTALEVLVDLGFSDMPIHADALRTLGTVHFRAGDAKEAQGIFMSALSIIQKWMSRADWESAPFQHCTHLDIFLVESVAKTHLAQARIDEARRLFAIARQQRLDRRLDTNSADVTEYIQIDNKDRMYTRHLY